MKRRIVVTSLMLFVLAAPAAAASIVVPSAMDGAEGNGGLFFPFAGSSLGARYQQVHEASAFGASGPLLLSQIAFRPDATDGAAFSRFFPELRVTLSTTATEADFMSTTLDDNVGPNATVTFDGAITLSTAFTGPVGGPKDFDIVIPFTTPFYYDPSAGNLLVEIRRPAGGAPVTPGFLFDSHVDFADEYSHMWNGFDPDATVANSGYTDGPIIQFTGTPVPEPSGLALFGLGLAGLATRRRRRQSIA